MNEFMQAVGDWFTVDRVVMLFWVYNAAVQALPEPDQTSSKLYIFAYRMAHWAAANINVVRKEVKPKPEPIQ